VQILDRLASERHTVRQALDGEVVRAAADLAVGVQKLQSSTGLKDIERLCVGWSTANDTTSRAAGKGGKPAGTPARNAQVDDENAQAKRRCVCHGHGFIVGVQCGGTVRGLRELKHVHSTRGRTLLLWSWMLKTLVQADGCTTSAKRRTLLCADVWNRALRT
jgi:hypothetical protein